jgi:GAF domain-containing protein
MVELTRELADRFAEAARLLEHEDDSDMTLRRLTGLAVELVPGATAAALTIEGDGQALTFAASDPRIDDLHRLQFQATEGPAVEALRRNAAQNVDDVADERRWPAFADAADRAGFGSCLMLPLRTDRRPAGAVSLYGRDRNAFRGASHDLAVLFAAQGGTAVQNAALYQACRQMVDNLHTALGSRAVIEQAKGILHAELGISPEEAFRLLSRRSQATNRKVREMARELVHGEIDAGQFRPAQQRKPSSC